MLATILVLSTVSIGAEPARVGQIIVLGNEMTPTSRILGRVPVYPGQVFPSRRELKTVEERLQKEFRATLDLTEGKSVRLELIDTGDSFRDLVIHFPEKKRR